jgi:ribosomal protein L34E
MDKFDIPPAEPKNQEPAKQAVTAQLETAGNNKNNDFIKKLAEEHECGICYELLYQPVQLAPCLHIYCGGCLSDWFKKQHDCPNCRKDIKTVTKSF